MCITDKVSAKSGRKKNHQKQYVKSRKKRSNIPNHEKKYPKTICQREKDTLSAGDVASCGVRPSHTPASKLDNLIQEQIHKRRTRKTQYIHLQNNIYTIFYIKLG